jgi:hypothetical protein
MDIGSVRSSNFVQGEVFFIDGGYAIADHMIPVSGKIMIREWLQGPIGIE